MINSSIYFALDIYKPLSTYSLP